MSIERDLDKTSSSRFRWLRSAEQTANNWMSAPSSSASFVSLQRIILAFAGTP